MKKLLPFAFILVLFFCSCSSNMLQWQQNRPLKWSDYKAKPDTGNFVAATTSGVGFTYEKLGEHTFKFTTYAVFFKNKSWVNMAYMNSYNRSAYSLRHEQLHFDISEYFARKLLAELKKHQYTDHYQDEMKQISLEMDKQREGMQLAYDQRTHHSLDRDQQAEWDKFITGLLAGLK